MSVPVRGPVLIVGTGLLGASVGLALRRAGVAVQLSDPDESALQEAVGRGAGERRTPGSEDPRIVVVAVPPHIAGSVMAQACAFPEATVTDVTSVKAVPLQQALGEGGDPARIVGGHPLAGREISGPAAARVELFDDRAWVVTPGPKSDPSRVQDVLDLVMTCGAVPLTMEPAKHDRAVAITSHTPQVLSSLIAARLTDIDDESVAVSGQALKDMTRIAGSDAGLWTSILSANAESVADVLDRLSRDLANVVADLRRGSTLAVGDVLERGAEGRARVPGKHGDARADFAVVPVIIQDKPGELGRLFAAMAALDVNLEDLRIDHVLGRQSGLVELFVRPVDADRLDTSLRTLGFDVRS